MSGKGGAHCFETVSAAADRLTTFGNRCLELAPLGLPRRVAAAILDHMILKRRAEVALPDGQLLGAVARAQPFDREVAVLANQFEREQGHPWREAPVQHG